jgi:hypothetical protein
MDNDRARDLVYPVASTRRRLEGYLMRRARALRNNPECGRALVQALDALDNSERTLRTMYVPNYEGL